MLEATAGKEQRQGHDGRGRSRGDPPAQAMATQPAVRPLPHRGPAEVELSGAEGLDGCRPTHDGVADDTGHRGGGAHLRGRTPPLVAPHPHAHGEQRQHGRHLDHRRRREGEARPAQALSCHEDDACEHGQADPGIVVRTVDDAHHDERVETDDGDGSRAPRSAPHDEHRRRHTRGRCHLEEQAGGEEREPEDEHACARHRGEHRSVDRVRVLVHTVNVFRPLVVWVV